MNLDEEAIDLIKRLEDLENRVISDRQLEACIFQSIKSLERIFGQKSILSGTLKKVKAVHKVERLDVAIRRSLKRDPIAIRVANARVSTNLVRPEIAIHKNSVISDFLVDTGKISSKRLREFQAFFHQRGAALQRALKGNDVKEVKVVLRDFIEALESEEAFLKDNFDAMVHDKESAWSLHNQIAHELSHWVYIGFSQHRAHSYRTAMNEAYSFSLQKSLHLFDDDYVFTKEKLLRHIREIYRLIVPRKHAYPERDYKFMKAFIILISILIICDAIARKRKDYRNKKLFIDSYAARTIKDIFALTNQALDNLKEYKEVLESTMLKTAISQLKKCKQDVIDNIEQEIKSLPKLKQERISQSSMRKGVLRLGSVMQNWKSLKEGISKIVKGNTSSAVASFDLLYIMGEDQDLKKYKKKYLSALEKVIKDIVDYSKGEEVKTFNSEKDFVLSMLAVIKGEEEVVSDILETLH